MDIIYKKTHEGGNTTPSQELVICEKQDIVNIANKIRTITGTNDGLSLGAMKNRLNDVDTSINKCIESVRNKKVNVPNGCTINDVSVLIDSISGEKYIIEVDVIDGATVYAVNGEDTVSGLSVNGKCSLEVSMTGDWTVYAEIDGVRSDTKIVNLFNNFSTNLLFFTANVSVSTSEGAVVTASKGSKVMTETVGSSGAVSFIIRDPGDWVFTATKDGKSLSETLSITEETNYLLELSLDLLTLNAVSWAKIREISDAGTGKNYWSVGDCKAVPLSGTMGTQALDTTLWVYILGFDHNKDVEGSGIQFGGFKTDSGSSGINVCLIDSKYGSSSTDGTKYFNMQHWGYANYGGWARCDMRYDILGSTDVAPLNYGKKAASGDVGYDATTTCATNPVANTLMSCLPVELRAVMKPITKYSDNIGRGTDVETNISASVDYLPLLAEFEVFGSRSSANSYEKNSQVQYEYFSAGNSRVKYRHSTTSSTAYWWERSPRYSSTSTFCFVNADGSASYGIAGSSYGVAPAFMV